MRQIILDTETTGLSPQQGHRVIEIGCVEMQNRRLTGEVFHVYLNPQRQVDPGAVNVHGITDDFLVDKPLFQSVAKAFQEFIDGAELIIHNAPFDVGFLENEFKIQKNKAWYQLDKRCGIFDTLQFARKRFPGQRNSLDALCKRFKIDNSMRQKHGALLDAEILADVYLALTGGQSKLAFSTSQMNKPSLQKKAKLEPTLSTQSEIIELPVIYATEEEVRLSNSYFE